MPKNSVPRISGVCRQASGDHPSHAACNDPGPISAVIEVTGGCAAVGRSVNHGSSQHLGKRCCDALEGVVIHTPEPLLCPVGASPPVRI